VPRLAVVREDAFAWVAAQGTSQAASFDLVCLDLFEAGRLAPGALATAFLRQGAAPLTPRGPPSGHLMVTARPPDPRAPLRRVFTITRELRLRGNLVVHAVVPAVGR